MPGGCDIRNWQNVTIDGKRSKDLDDAVSAYNGSDIYHLGVIIADVSKYVQEEQCALTGKTETGTRCVIW